MSRFVTEKFRCYFDEFYNELSYIDSIIEITKMVCLDLELSSEYYGLTHNMLKLSKERNHYINMLTIASEKITKIKEINCNLENLLK